MRGQARADVERGDGGSEWPPTIRSDYRGKCCVCGQGFGGWAAVLMGDGRKARTWDHGLAPDDVARRRPMRKRAGTRGQD